MKASDYGNRYWRVIGKGGDIHLYADKVVVSPDGNLLFVREKGGEQQNTFAISAGRWDLVYAASTLDGSAVCVEHWRPVRDDE